MRRIQKKNNLPESPEELVGRKITALKAQIRDPKRVSVFLDGHFFCGIGKYLSDIPNLSVGQKIDIPHAEKLLIALKEERCRNYLIKCLERREHSRLELFQKAVQKAHDPSICESQIEQLNERGWQSDLRFAEQICVSKKNAGWGFHKIRAYLLKKGIKQEVIKQLGALLVTTEEENTARMMALIQKKAGTWSKYPTQKRKERIYRHLIQKGFDGNAILKHLPELMDLIPAPH